VRYEPPDADLSATVELTHQSEPVRLTGREPAVLPMPAAPDHGPEPSPPHGRRPARRRTAAAPPAAAPPAAATNADRH